jgi:hypothetical protein
LWSSDDSQVGYPTQFAPREKGGRAAPPAVVMRSGVIRGRLVVFDMRLGGFGGVVRSVLMMAVSEVRVARG